MRIQEGIELKNFCTFKIGGQAKFLINWENTDEIEEILEFARNKNLPIFVFGGGSNLLFDDGNWDAIFIRCATKEIKFDEKTQLLEADAGVRWPILAKFCSDNQLFGLEAFWGLPGTVGGALYGNAGCHGCEMKDVVSLYETFDLKSGKKEQLELNKSDFSYRHSVLQEPANSKKIITRCWFKVSKDPKLSFGNAQEFAEFRNTKQPKGLTTGSFFKNPKGHFAGQLLEEAGLKGFCLGEICFSDKHANFMINKGEATATDVKKLTEFAKEKVFINCGVKLEPEVRIITKDKLIDIL